MRLCVIHRIYFAFLVIGLISRACSRCPNFCSGHGKCLPSAVCDCFPGWGSKYDITDFRSPDCSKRVCKYGLSWGNIQDFDGNAHGLKLECSGIGTCNRLTGQCKCPKGYSGSACERRNCPNNCSGHGRCMSMKKLAMTSDALPLIENNVNITYGSVSLNNTKTWDSDMIYGCVCDSSWTVGLNSGETQEPEWFGADCSLRHCPSNDDPMTSKNETDCYNVTASNGGVGNYGNLCQVDCANRGICDYSTGTCQCFKNFYGLDCTIPDSLAIGAIYVNGILTEINSPSQQQSISVDVMN